VCAMVLLKKSSLDYKYCQDEPIKPENFVQWCDYPNTGHYPTARDLELPLICIRR